MFFEHLLLLCLKHSSTVWGKMGRKTGYMELLFWLGERDKKLYI